MSRKPDPLYVQFECGQEDRFSREFGPYDWVQLTYTDLQISPDGELLADFYEGKWWISQTERYTDVIIYSRGPIKYLIEGVEVEI